MDNRLYRVYGVLNRYALRSNGTKAVQSSGLELTNAVHLANSYDYKINVYLKYAIYVSSHFVCS
jgi:hypothetical protein